MATEQDWAAYADQGFLALTDTLLARTAAGAGVQIPGTNILARRSAAGAFDGTGPSGDQLRLRTSVSEYFRLGRNASDGLFEFWGSQSGFAGYKFGGVDGEWVRISPDGNVNLFRGRPLLFWRADNATVNQISYESGDRFWFNQNNGGSYNFAISGSNKLTLTSTYLAPGSDNFFSLGLAPNRWTTVFASTGTINTSDEREKVWRGPPDDAELRAARRIVAELGFYQWIDAVEEKGPDGARFHFGIRAQQVWAIMADEGLVDPVGADGRPGTTPYAFLCFDEWEEQREEEYETVTRTRIVPEPSSIIGVPREVEETYEERVPTGRQVVTLEAGNRFGLRVDQLALFLIAAQQARLAALEAAA